MTEALLPKVGVGVFVVRGESFLTCQRKGSHGSGSWSVPGGHLEFGETPQECAVRETKEESGLIVNVEDMVELGFTNDFFPEEKKHYVTLYYVVEYKGKGKPHLTEPERQTAWEWVSWEEFCAKEVFLPIRNAINTGTKPLEALRATKV